MKKVFLDFVKFIEEGMTIGKTLSDLDQDPKIRHIFLSNNRLETLGEFLERLEEYKDPASLGAIKLMYERRSHKEDEDEFLRRVIGVSISSLLDCTLNGKPENWKGRSCFICASILYNTLQQEQD